MSIKNFIPTIWSARLLEHLRKTHVMAALTNRDYEGEIRDYGDTVKINQIGDIEVHDYTKNQDIQLQTDISGPQRILVIDQAKAFNFAIDDVDQAQTNPKLMDAAMRQAAYALSDAQDQYLLKKYTEAGNSLGSQGEPIVVDEENVIRVLIEIGKLLNKANVPTTGRWIVVDPEFHAQLVLAKLLNDTANSETLANGYVGFIGGFAVHLSNNVPNVGGVSKIMAGTNQAITLAEQIVKTEAYRREASFGDGVKGLHVYGAKVVQPKALCAVSVIYDENGENGDNGGDDGEEN